MAEARTDVVLPQPVIAEIEYGLARLPASKRKVRLQRRFDLCAAEIPRIEWTDDVSREFGRIKARLERAGTPIEDFDAAIAAHAVAEGATLVTDNVEQMSRLRGLSIENCRA